MRAMAGRVKRSEHHGTAVRPIVSGSHLTMKVIGMSRAEPIEEPQLLITECEYLDADSAVQPAPNTEYGQRRNCAGSARPAR